ncbi:MAG TPA: ATP-binding protein [Steroidobacteraceae bacterium]|nr:ATP-binding protein [Steroidobacteraceae bacterium]
MIRLPDSLSPPREARAARKAHSLSRRLLISVAVPLALFFVVMSFVLDSGFRTLSDRQVRALLNSQIVTLIAAAEPDSSGGYDAPLNGLDTRLTSPDSGLYAQIRSNNLVWRSPSTAGVPIDFGPALAQGDRTFSYSQVGHTRVATESRGISFADDPKQPGHALTFSVAVSLTPYEAQLWAFRSRMLGWFTGLMVLLLLSLAAILRGVLAPLRRLEREIHEVEEGRSEMLGSGYPRELSGVARHLNALLVGERKRVARYRDTLGNLAHGLKTPLAVMRATLRLDHASGGSTSAMGKEIDRMTDIIEHQLKRAAASGGALLGQAPVAVAVVATDLRGALLRVYSRKDLSIELAIQEGVCFIGDRGDFVELLGNLMDNACKWCRERVRVAATVEESLVLVVEDDGPGIAEENRVKVLERGVRTDEKVPGHGLGLAMVHDTVDLYGGKLTVDASALGGARFSLRLPGKRIEITSGTAAQR